MSADPAIRRRRAYLDLALRRARSGSGSTREFLLARTWQGPGMDLGRIRTPYVIVGEMATALYMPQRLTFDLDILVPAEEAPRLYRELAEAGYQRRGQLTIGGTSWQAPDGSPLAVLEARESWARTAVTNPNRSPTGEPVIALPYLVLLKLAASRAQDVADLSRMLGPADEAILRQVRDAVRRHRPEDSGDLESLIALGRLELADERTPPGVEGR